MPNLSTGVSASATAPAQTPNSTSCAGCGAWFASTDCVSCLTGRYAPLSTAVIATLVDRYVELKATSDRLGSIPAPDLSPDDWRTLWDADDEANKVWRKLDDAGAIRFLPADALPLHLKHLAEPLPAPLPVRIPAAPSSALSVAELSLTTEIAYLERDRQLFEQVRYELAAGGAL